jgi:outer membrane protein assembly factor BamB
MGEVRAGFYLALIAVLLTLIGCGDSTGATGVRAKAPIVANRPGLADGLPAPSELRTAKVITSGVLRYGSQYASALPSQLATVNGHLLALAPAWLGAGLEGAAYAVYAFDSTGYSTDDTLHLEWQATGESASDSWIGLANFTRDRWDWFAGPGAGELPYDPAQYTDSGKVYAVVLCLGTDAWELKSARICADLPPVVLSVSPQICTAGTSVRFTARLEGTADSYSWSFGGGATPDNSVDSAPQVTIGAVGSYNASVTVANGCGSDLYEFTLLVRDLASQDDWRMFGHDCHHTRRSHFNGPATSAVKWTFATEAEVRSSPVIEVDGTVYVSSWDGNTYAINPDGTLKWSYAMGGSGSSPAIGADGTMYQGSYDGDIYAVNPDGSLKWSYDIQHSENSSPTIGADGTVFVASGWNFYAFNPDGSLKWTYNNSGYGQFSTSAAISADGTAYVGTDGSQLYAIDPDGSLKWTYIAGGHIYSAPAIAADGTVYVGTNDQELCAINPDGSQKWIYETGGMVYSSPALRADGTICVGCSNYRLYAINSDGSLQWFYTTMDAFLSSPAIDASGTVYVGNADSNVYAINADGSLKWTCKTGSYAYSSPAIGADGTVYIGSDDYKLYAIGPGGG